MDKAFIENFIRRLTPDQALEAADLIHDVFGISADQKEYIKDLETELTEKDDKITELETELGNEKEDFEARMGDMVNEIEEAQNEPCRDLLYMAEQYRLSDAQYYQDEIIKILENEYNLALIVAPANHQ